MARTRHTGLKAMVLWLWTVSGGMVFGWGVFLVAQVRVVRHLREQIDQISAIDRFLGKMTFLWRTPDEKLLFALEGLPESYLEHSHALGIGLGIAGLAAVLLVPLYLRWRWSR